MKVANAYLTSEKEQGSIVWAVRPPFHHMRVLRWQLRTVMRYGYPWQDRERYNWMPPRTANNWRGDQWWFRGPYMARVSRGARRAMNDSAAWDATIKQVNGNIGDLGAYRGFRLEEPFRLFIPAPTHLAYRGRVVRLPARSLIEHANHHLRRTLAHSYKRSIYDKSTPWSIR